MYQRDNRQKEVRKREKENDRGRARGRDRETEGGRGHLEATGGGLRPVTALFHTYTQMSFHKYVLGVYHER